MRVPFIDLRPQHEDLMSRITPAIEQVFEENCFILGPVVEQFESAAAKMLGVVKV